MNAIAEVEEGTAPVRAPAARAVPEPDPPMSMLAELTHRCPLKCPYCSNPTELVRRSGELSTAEWLDVFHQAGRMGVLHVHLSGGEPASRRDLPELVAGAAEAGLYSNLITSGVGLREATFAECVENGLDHVQLSVQGADAATADRIGGYRGGFARKMEVAGWITGRGLPLTVNAVMHRQNLDRLEETIELARRLGARRLEVAHTQYHGWALTNRAALMPRPEQVDKARETVEAARESLTGVMAIDYVPPDHYARFPKACMGGWGRMGLNVSPEGKVLPCHAAESIPTLTFETVRDRPLADIWRDGPAFAAYRGTDWMPPLCRGCERREIDWGGCRCQAMAVLGDAGETDPVCSRSPHHARLRERAEIDGTSTRDDFVYRG